VSDPVVVGVALAELPDVQAAAVREVIDFLWPEERRDSYTITRVEPWRAPWPEGTVRFTDAEDRTWYVRPNGTYSWVTR
jgi:hypothetical protein